MKWCSLSISISISPSSAAYMFHSTGIPYTIFPTSRIGLTHLPMYPLYQYFWLPIPLFVFKSKCLVYCCLYGLSSCQRYWYSLSPFSRSPVLPFCPHLTLPTHTLFFLLCFSLCDCDPLYYNIKYILHSSCCLFIIVNKLACQ